MPKNEPNQASRDLMSKAAAEAGAVSKNLAEMATAWGRVAELLLAGQLAEADKARGEAIRMTGDLHRPAKRAADYIRAVRLTDGEFWDEQVRLMDEHVDRVAHDEVRAEVARLTPKQAGVELIIHEALCPNKGCEVSQLLKARSLEVERDVPGVKSTGGKL